MLQDLPVTLARQRPEHAQGLYAALKDPAVHAFLDSEPPRSVAEVRERIGGLMAGGPPDGSEIWLNWTVFHHDRIVGTTQASIETSGTASIAYALTPGVWGKGVAQRAAELTIAELAARHAISRLIADTETGNLASQGLLHRLGFAETHRTGQDIFYARAL